MNEKVIELLTLKEDLGETDFLEDKDWQSLSMNGKSAGFTLKRLPEGGVHVTVRSRILDEKIGNALELAWGLIANAYGGDWELASDEWRETAIRWRDEHWHPFLDSSGGDDEE